MNEGDALLNQCHVLYYDMQSLLGQRRVLCAYIIFIAFDREIYILVNEKMTLHQPEE
jgi:hypothetical protein